MAKHHSDPDPKAGTTAEEIAPVNNVNPTNDPCIVPVKRKDGRMEQISPPVEQKVVATRYFLLTPPGKESVVAGPVVDLADAVRLYNGTNSDGKVFTAKQMQAVECDKEGNGLPKA